MSLDYNLIYYTGSRIGWVSMRGIHNEVFCTIVVPSLYGECDVIFLPGMVFFYLVTTGWSFDISLLCQNSRNNKIKYSFHGQIVACQYPPNAGYRRGVGIGKIIFNRVDLGL